ncbi:MAG: hypothetical protein LBT20_07910, partial [Clostridiales bacterium]|nr:hypothetical protein [Clostridiales bacterium]
MKKLYGIVTAFVLIAVFATVSAAVVMNYKPKVDWNGGGGQTVVEQKTKPTEVLDKILTGARLAFPEGSYDFNIDTEAYFELSGNGKNTRFELKVNLTLDLDTDMSASKNLFIVELNQIENGSVKPLFGLYYKDDITATPYLYVSVGSEKHAIKFFSVKKLLND